MIFGESVGGAIRYNEKKISSGVCQLISGNGFWKSEAALSLHEKIMAMEKLESLNTQAKYTCLHASLNFAPGEEISNVKASQIASEYMEKVGFGDQPYLVYRHYDSGHPHIHIVAPTIQASGVPIDLHYIAKKKSAPARIELENKYGLIKAMGRGKEEDIIFSSNITKAEYGKGPTKKQISNVVRAVIRHYKFTSLNQYNTILRQYNVTIDQGPEGSVMREKGGLRYSIIDDAGEKVGKPIKASLIPDSPILSNIEKRFFANKQAKQKSKHQVQKAVSDAIAMSTCETKEDFKLILAKSQIQVIYYANDQGRIYGISFIDHVNRTAFNGRELSKDMALSGIEKQLKNKEGPVEKDILSQQPSLPPSPYNEKHTANTGTYDPRDANYEPSTFQDFIMALLQSERVYINYYDPYKKKKKGKQKEQER